MAYRLSLPTRALSFDKIPKDELSSRPPKFSTVNLGKGLARRRANISSAFSNLWEKSENRNNSASSSHLSATTPGWSTSRIENIGASRDLKHRHVYGLQQTIIEPTDSVTSNGPLRVPFIDHGFLRVGTPFSAGFQEFSPHASPEFESPNIVSVFDDSKRIDGSRRQLDLPPDVSLHRELVNACGVLDVQNIRLDLAPSSSSSPELKTVGGAVHTTASPPVIKPQEDTSEEGISDLDLNHTRSASSFYPSEGIRSDECTSPVLNFNRGRNFSLSSVSQYLRNSRKAWLRSTCRTDDSTGDRNIDFTLQEELAAAGRISDTGSVTMDDVNAHVSNECLRVPPVSSEGDNRSSQSVKTITGARSIVDRQARQCLDSSLSSSAENHNGHRVSDVDSTTALRSSTDSEDSGTTTLRGPGQCAPPPTRNQSPVSYQYPIFSPSTDESTPSDFEPLELQKKLEATTVTLVERVRKLKLKKWVKRVCRTTKVRFRHVMNPRDRVEKVKEHTAKVAQKGGVKRILSGPRKTTSGIRKAKESKKPRMKCTAQLPRNMTQDVDFGKFGELFRVKRSDTVGVKGVGDC
jgi:hypothetical protein